MSADAMAAILLGSIGVLVLYATGLWWGIPLLVAVLWYQHRDMANR